MRTINVKVRRFKSYIEWKQTDKQTDTTESITFLVNTVRKNEGKERVTVKGWEREERTGDKRNGKGRNGKGGEIGKGRRKMEVREREEFCAAEISR